MDSFSNDEERGLTYILCQGPLWSGSNQRSEYSKALLKEKHRAELSAQINLLNFKCVFQFRSM